MAGACTNRALLYAEFEWVERNRTDARSATAAALVDVTGGVVPSVIATLIAAYAVSVPPSVEEVDAEVERQLRNR